MPTGPKGQKRPADVIGNAVRVMRIATGEEDDTIIDDGKDLPQKRSVRREGRLALVDDAPDEGGPRLLTSKSSMIASFPR